jgi:SAM-dependent methyltransferase
MTPFGRAAVMSAVRQVADQFKADARDTILCENFEKHVQEVQLIADASPDRTAAVIDVGGGLGINLLVLRALGWSGTLVLVDRLTEYTAGNRMGESSRALELLRTADVTTNQLDIWPECSLPYADGSFDVATTFDVIEHLPGHPLRQLIEMRRVLAPQGHCIVGAPNATSLMKRLHLARGSHPYMPFEEWLSDDYIFHYREYTKGEYCALMERAGYRVVESRMSDAVTMSRARTHYHRRRHHALAPVAIALRVVALAERAVPALRHSVYTIGVPAATESVGSAVRSGRARSNSAPLPS